MAGIYEDLLMRARTAYRYASVEFHSEEVRREIAAALDGFTEPLRNAAAAPRGTAATNVLRQLESQMRVLRAAIAAAAREGRSKVARVALLDRAKWAQRASIQQGADDALMEQVETLLGEVREDLQAGGGGDEPGTPPAPLPTPEPGDLEIAVEPIDVKALEAEIRKLAAKEQDHLVASQLADISGERTEAGEA